MPLNLCNHQEKAVAAVQRFRDIRELAPREKGAGRANNPTSDPMSGFVQLMRELVEENGLPDATVSFQHPAPPRPGPFCPEKLWSMAVIHRDRLIAALDLKWKVAPAGQDAETLAADALGSSHDFWTAYREDAFGVDVPKPFLGWLILVECHDDAVRFDQVCKMLVREQHYTAACVVQSQPNNREGGRCEEGSGPTGLTSFVADFAAHMAACSRRERSA
jgi:hypothetical protein